jgi:ribonuclease HI
MLYTIYTDGSCLKNPGGPGGYAAVIFRDDELIEELSGGDAVTTNNRMEIMAAVVGLRAVREPSVVTLYSDSQYLIKTLTLGWKRMKNVDLWARLDQAAKPHRVSWQWVRGHNGNPGNVRADALANQAARQHRVHAGLVNLLPVNGMMRQKGACPP